VAEVVVSQQAFERPCFTAQGMPVELVATLRTAFDATMREREGKAGNEPSVGRAA
jgi:hypothetical protein